MNTSVPTILRRTAHAAAAVAIVLPLIVLLCWTYDHRLLSDLHPSFSAVKPHSLLSLFLCGIALRLQLDLPLTIVRRRTAQACGLLACLSAALMLSEHLFGFDFGSGEWFFTRPETPGDPDLERTAPPTAFAVLLLGSALWRLDGTPIGRHDPAQYAALLGGMVGGVALVGYLYEVQSLYKVGTFSSISLLTGMLLTAIGLGILCARPEKGFMATLVSDELGGLMLRRILPFAIALPILAGWIRLTAQRSGYDSVNFSVAMAVAVVMLIMLALLWVLAGTLNSTDEQKKHLLQILQQREARHRLALRAGRMGTFHHDLDNQSWMCSPELEAIFGVPTMTFGGTFAAFMEIVHPEDRSLVDRTIRDAIQNRSSYDMECRIIRAAAPKDAWIAITGQVLPDVQGRPRQITGVMFDVTERKEADTALRRSEEQLRVITDALPGLIAYVDRDERYRFVNAGYERHFGLPRDRIVGRSVSDLAPQQYQEVRAYIRRALNGEQVSFETTSGRAGEGTLLTSYVPNRTAEGTVAGLYALTTDITDRKRTEERLHEWTAELEQRVHERTRALVLSQERLRALASDLSATEQQERRRLATELHDYLAQLLVVGRMKLGQAKPHIREPKIQQLLSEADDALTQSLTYTRFLVAELSPQVLYQFGLPAALKWLAGQMKTHGLTVETHCEADHLPLAENRAVILYQSVRELLFNVVKHAGTDEASVTLAYDGEETLTITVADRGCGFNPAGTAEPGGQHAGRFGLFNIQERIEAIGGRLHLTSAKGHGTSISLVAPLAAEPSSSPSPSLPRAAQPAVSSAVHSQRLRILLVDDHAMVRQGLRSVLENYQDLEVVGEAGDGEAAISLTAALNPDVVVMDINMPRVDGIAATRRIVAAHPDIVVIGLSVQNERHVEDAMLGAGAAVFVTKERAAVQLYEAIVSTVRTRA